jgi:APA family basic amino acid/polyamine antiporter
LNIAIVASTIFALRRKAKLEGLAYSGARAPLYPVLPAFFVLFLLGISVNVLLTQTKQAMIGAIFLVTGLPVFFLMRRINKSPRPAAPLPPAQA